MMVSIHALKIFGIFMENLNEMELFNVSGYDEVKDQNMPLGASL